MLITHTDDQGAQLDSGEAFKTMLGKYGTKLEIVALRDGERFGEFDQKVLLSLISSFSHLNSFQESNDDDETIVVILASAAVWISRGCEGVQIGQID